MMKRILVVEDDAIIAYGLIYALEQAGYAVLHSKCVSEAISAIMNNKIDLVLLDMQLPDGTGFDVRKKLEGTDTASIE